MNPLDQLHHDHDQDLITDRVEATFGPNPCESLHLTNEDTGEVLHLNCNTKKCVDCGPRKKMTMQLQMEHLGQHVYVARLTTLDDLEKALERAKKQAQRNGYTYRYQIVGDDTLGYIVISDVELIDEQRYMKLADWHDRIFDMYHNAARRIRRSRALGSMSLVRLLRKNNQGQASPWYRRDANSDVVASVEGLTWPVLMEELEQQREHQSGDAWI